MQSIENQIRERVARFLEVTGVRLPLMNAPMAEVAGSALTAAVCRAGGLGILAGDELSPEELAESIDEVRRLVGVNERFAVNLRVPPAKSPTSEDRECQRKMLSALEDLAADLGLEAGTLEPLPDFDAQFDVLLQKRVPLVAVCAKSTTIVSSKPASPGWARQRPFAKPRCCAPPEQIWWWCRGLKPVALV